MVHLLPLVATAALASARADPTTASEREPFGPERGMFEIRPRDAWTIVQERLKGLGLKVDKIDPDNQALLTRWRRVSRKDADWLPALHPPEPYVADRIRFEVFVSPFIEPARVYVGSQIDAVRSGLSEGAPGATVYNKVTANRALMAEIARAFASAAVPRFVPSGAERCRVQPTTAPGVKTDPSQADPAKRIRDRVSPSGGEGWLRGRGACDPRRWGGRQRPHAGPPNQQGTPSGTAG
jgi:hypothetical protein